MPLIRNANDIKRGGLGVTGAYAGTKRVWGSRKAPVSAAATSRPFFYTADWLWNKIPASPVLDPNSATWATLLGQGQHICDIIEFGVAARGPGGSSGATIDGSTPRSTVSFRQATGGGGDNWGAAPFTDSMPWPSDLVVPGITAPGITPSTNPPYDGHVAVADPTNDAVYNLWRAYNNGSSKTAWWGSKVPLSGDGRESDGVHSSTGARLARYGGIVRASEMTAGVIPHALFFSTNMAAAATRYPAQVGDGANGSGVATPIPEGARIQLNPAFDVNTITNPWERIIAKALQDYGAYCGDNGGARMAFLFEYLGTTGTANQPYLNVWSGIYDYYDMVNIPWASQLRVLNSWNGT